MTSEVTKAGGTIRISVNDEELTIASMSVHDFLRSIKCDPMPLAVELNLSILKKNQYHETLLAEGDQLEIIWFVGGG